MYKKISQDIENSFINELKDYIFKNNILFLDISTGNILLQEYEKNKFRLVIIDDLGVNSISIRYFFSVYCKIYRKLIIRKKWEKFMEQVNIKREEAKNWKR
ncbi:hypothetical protein CJ672_09855 [Arcobacter cryaerophilus gv. occultus]|uniref:YrbL family protein n=1 Tax=Aliarcobacter cryaerophilus TaxID=28198 RepID=UPI000D012C21|nr:YrbL family protein [Aliarcobacter cryaerophilus]PRM91308.1 hypothetical protein CJ672_09855 [Arcobacter cryaerophilus gv. occultus]